MGKKNSANMNPGGRPRTYDWAQIERLRRSGYSFSEIGELVGCCKQAAHYVVTSRGSVLKKKRRA